MAFFDNLSPYQISGALNFGTVPAPGDYMTAYGNALNLNKGNYQNILAGYQGLSSSVLGNLKDVGVSQQQDIQDTYGREQGRMMQSLISRGLGNSTVQDSMRRGLMTDRTKAENHLAGQMAQLYAGYQSQLGRDQLAWMNSVSAPYPNLDSYNRLAQMQGATRGGGSSYPSTGGGGTRVNMPRSGGFGGMSMGSSSPMSGISGVGTSPFSTSAMMSMTNRSMGMDPYTEDLWNYAENYIDPYAGDNWAQGGVETWSDPYAQFAGDATYPANDYYSMPDLTAYDIPDWYDPYA